MAVITLVATAAGRDFMERARAALREAGHDARSVTGTSAVAAGPARLAQTELLIPIAAACDAQAMRAAPRLRAIVSPVIGIDGIDLEAATTAGILVVGGSTEQNVVSMAEATFMLILAGLYDLEGSRRRMSDPGAPMRPRRMLSGKTVGILGYGAIARALIARLAAWNVDILVHNRTVPPVPPERVCFVARETLLAGADVIVPLLALNHDTRHVLDAAALARMKPDALLVNTSRGAIADEAALADWLAGSPARGAALDVFEQEPLALDSPLRSLPNALLTPHCVGHSVESGQAMLPALLEAVDAVLAGHAPRNSKNPGVIECWERGAA